jgi:hypothetical protein
MKGNGSSNPPLSAKQSATSRILRDHERNRARARVSRHLKGTRESAGGQRHMAQPDQGRADQPAGVYDQLGLYTEPGRGDAMRVAIDWFNQYL